MLAGSMTALVTPFKDGEVDYAALEALVELQITQGTHAVVHCGSTGESANGLSWCAAAIVETPSATVLCAQHSGWQTGKTVSMVCRMF